MLRHLNSLANFHRFVSMHPLTRDAPYKAWRRFLGWQLTSRFQNERVVPWIGNQSLAVRHGMRGATASIYVGLQEFADMLLALHFLRKGDLFLDIGSNVGTYTILASGVCRARTWAFEPDPNAATGLRRNIALNNLEELVDVYECALGSERAQIQFSKDLDTENKVVTASNLQTREVRQEALDDIIGENEPTMIKIDVEGYEQRVLEGGRKVLKNPSLRVIEIETVTRDITAILKEDEFCIYYYDPYRRVLSSQPVGFRPNNTLFVRDIPFVQRRLSEAPSVQVLGQSI